MAQRNDDDHPKVIFASYAGSPDELSHVALMAESLRTFGGRYAQAPVWVFLPKQIDPPVEADLSRRLVELRVELRSGAVPEDAAWFYYAGKTFAAGQAEAEADGKAEVLVWLDEDTIFLREPRELELEKPILLGYRPVMHNRSGSLASGPPGEFWSRVYELLELDPDSLFTMVTPADRKTIRAYFNAGLVAVRPERGVLRGWGEAFKKLYRDPKLAAMCRDEVTWRIFLHQVALVGPAIKQVDTQSMRRLPDSYNYPIFFKKMYGAEEEFDDLTDVVTLRYDIYFRDPEPGWYEQLKAPAETLNWLKARLPGA